MTKRHVSGKILMYLVLLFLYLPIFVLIVFSFNASKSRSIWNGFSLKWYEKLFGDAQILSALTTTLEVSFLAAALATILGTFAAIGFFYMKRRWRAPLMAINNIPMTNADIVTGVSMALLFVSAGSLLNFKQGFMTMLIAHITFNVPYVILAIMPKLRQMDGNLVHAAEDLGCTWFQAFYKVIIPEIKPGIVNGAIIAFTMSIDDFVISLFTAGSKVQTLSMAIWSMTKKNVTPEINAVSTLLFSAVLILLVIINLREIHQEKRQAQEAAALNG